ncbi:MAG: START-like domain-containing protein [Bacteroidales bacterium]|mgnify:CR=1 FL=1|jgi:uncharacterized protein YndB with AHSA1/START domain|nr:START-like domain-containing protein [Bacteroidales bacterium]NLM91515.1 SRPBCC domain-containing protein [Bacteroidales bacterium]
MSALEKFSLDFHIETTPRLLYTLISTPEGLTRWFAHTMLLEEGEFLFNWEGNEQHAKLVEAKENEYVMFQWLEDYHKDLFLEMRIDTNPEMEGVTLVITDYAEASDVDFSKRLWESQVGQLQRIFNA